MLLENSTQREKKSPPTHPKRTPVNSTDVYTFFYSQRDFHAVTVSGIDILLSLRLSFMSEVRLNVLVRLCSMFLCVYIALERIIFSSIQSSCNASVCIGSARREWIAKKHVRKTFQLYTTFQSHFYNLIQMHVDVEMEIERFKTNRLTHVCKKMGAKSCKM